MVTGFTDITKDHFFYCREKDERNDCDLGEIAANENVRYVLNFPSVRLYERNAIAYATIKVQFDDSKTNELLLDADFTGDWTDPHYEFMCEDKTIQCTVNNALSDASGR